MAQLKNLKPSLSEIPYAESLGIIITIRKNRREVRESRAIAAREPKPTKARSLQALDINTIDTNSLENLIALMGEILNGSQD